MQHIRITQDVMVVGWGSISLPFVAQDARHIETAYLCKTPIVAHIIMADPSCNLLSSHKAVRVIEMLTARCSIPHPDFIGRCCCEEYNTSILCSIHLWE